MSHNSEDTPVQYEPIQPRHLSHDLRGPLNSVLGFTELLLDGIEGPLNEIQMEDIAAIQQSAKDLLQLINNIVDLSKLDVDQLQLNLAPVALDEIINELVPHPAAKKNNVKIALEMPAKIPAVEVDRQRITQTLGDLVKFLQTQGATQIQIHLLAESRTVTTRITAPEVTLTARQQAELFEATALVDPSGRSKLTIGGISLPLAAKLIAVQRGNLSASSMPTAGVTFVLTLPVSQTQ